VHSPSKVAHLIVALLQAGDIDLLDNDILLSKACAPKHHAAIRRTASLIHDIHSNCNFTDSPQFLRESASKSTAYISMATRLQDAPVKRKEFRARLLDSFLRIVEDDEIFTLAAERYHAQLFEARSALIAAART
jgi:hypothetical protein